MSEITKTIRVDDHLDDYKGFFDPDWGNLLQAALRQTKLSSAGFDLIASWKGISEARRFPWLMVQAVIAALEGSVNFAVPIPSQALNELLARLTGGLERHHVSLSGADREALCSEIRSIESQISDRAKLPFRLDPNELWSHFLQSQGIALSLLMSEVNAYAAVYFGYEDYLIRTMKAARGLKTLRPRDLKRKLEDALGKKVAEMCWSEKQIEMSRLIRHAIVHNGRKITDDLKKYSGELILEGDDVMIMAHHTTELYNLLKERALFFTTEIVKLPTCRIEP